MTNTKTEKTREISYEDFGTKWENSLTLYLPGNTKQITQFADDNEFGLRHSYDVFLRSLELVAAFDDEEKEIINLEILEHISIFHDIGKFFQEVHSLENITIAEAVYTSYAKQLQTAQEVQEVVIDGIKSSDFYNVRLDPLSKPPNSLEGDIVRAADKMLPNIISKVDRYWYKYGIPRKATFFDPSLSLDERAMFSFANFCGDQMNVILSIIGLRPEDFLHPVLQREYEKWSLRAKEAVVQRILSLAQEIGEPPEEIETIKKVIKWYRESFGC